MIERVFFILFPLFLFFLISSCRNEDQKEIDSGAPDTGEDDTEPGSTGASDTGKDDSESGSTDNAQNLPELPGAPWFQCLDDTEYPPEGSVVVTAFELEDQYNGGEPNKRNVEKEVVFPETKDWARIDMLVQTSCPEDYQCDFWDRFANISLIDKKGTDEEETIELVRYITPYRVEMCALYDMTQFAPLFTGTKTLKSFIDTWVYPGNDNGHGWRTTIRFIFHPGVAPEGLPRSLTQLWPFTNVVVGDPAKTIESQIGTKRVDVPAEVKRAELRMVVTGHGQGNHLNCAEFCSIKQVVIVNEKSYAYDPWRGNCEENPLDIQLGSWYFPRAGWCPGAPVLPKVFDITEAIVPGKENTFAYQVWESDGKLYENTCRPGNGTPEGDAGVCDGCLFEKNQPGNCNYNGGNHTQPSDKIAVQLVLY